MAAVLLPAARHWLTVSGCCGVQALLKLQAAAAAWDTQLQQASRATTEAVHQQYEALDLQSVEAGDFEPADEIRAAEGEDHPMRMHTARCSSYACACVCS